MYVLELTKLRNSAILGVNPNRRMSFYKEDVGLSKQDLY